MRDYASLYKVLLSDLGFCDQTDLGFHHDDDIRTVGSKSLAKSFLKKLSPHGDSEVPDAAALAKFKGINSRIAEFDANLFASSEADSVFLDIFTDILNRCFRPPEEVFDFGVQFLTDNIDIGPGAAQKADSSSLHTKLFGGVMSSTSVDLVRYYRSAISTTGLWADAEMQRFNRYGNVIVRGGEIFFAPKDAEISRTCCTEANVNMLIQKACGAALLRSLTWEFGITLETQASKNKVMARIGSIDQSFGTIDLVSASDSISMSMLRNRLRPSPLWSMMQLSRSNRAVLPDGSEVDLKMISTMGNGFTFPLQTIIFASVVKAVYTMKGLPCSDPRTEFGVYGDDIVVCREAYYSVAKYLTMLGFVVNDQKSFNTGPFRESCGGDFYNGTNIRGVYVRSLESPQLIFSAINRLVRWSARTGVMLTGVIKLLLKWAGKTLLVPPSESDDAGVHVPFDMTLPRLTSAYWFKYRKYVSRSQKVAVRCCDREFEGPPCAQLGASLGFLGGYIRRPDQELVAIRTPEWESRCESRPATYTLRERPNVPVRYKIVTTSLPWWDLPFGRSVSPLQALSNLTITWEGAWGYLEYCNPKTAALEGGDDERVLGDEDSSRWRAAARGLITFD